MPFGLTANPKNKPVKDNTQRNLLNLSIKKKTTGELLGKRNKFAYS